MPKTYKTAAEMFEEIWDVIETQEPGEAAIALLNAMCMSISSTALTIEDADDAFDRIGPLLKATRLKNMRNILRLRGELHG